jgi:hypothetical protein
MKENKQKKRNIYMRKEMNQKKKPKIVYPGSF